MLKMRILGAAAAASVLLLPTNAATAAPDDAARAGKNFATVLNLDGAKLQLCKVSFDDGAKYRVFARLNNKAGSGETGGRVRVQKDGKNTKVQWYSGMISRGRISDVGSVVVPNKPGFRLEVSAFQSQMGTGGTRGLVKIQAC